MDEEPQAAGPTEPDPLEERVARIEEALGRFSHFISAELRPDLGGATFAGGDKSRVKDSKDRSDNKAFKDSKDAKDKDKDKDIKDAIDTKDPKEEDKTFKDVADKPPPLEELSGSTSMADRVSRIEAALAQLTQLMGGATAPDRDTPCDG